MIRAEGKHDKASNPDNVAELESQSEKPQWLSELETSLGSVNWNAMLRELQYEGFASACDVVGMRIARILQEKGKQITPVQVVLPDESSIITNNQAHVAFIIQDGDTSYFADFTYALYAPQYSAYKANLSTKRPYLLTEFHDDIPEIKEVELYQAMLYEKDGEQKLVWAPDIKMAEDDGEPMEQVMLESAKKYYLQELEKNDGMDLYGGLDRYIRSMLGIDVDTYAHKLTPRQKRLMSIANQKMTQSLSDEEQTDENFRKRWVDDVASIELNKLLKKVSESN